MDLTLEPRKQRARTWFEALREEICTRFESLEACLPPDAMGAVEPAGKFTRTAWNRTDHSGAPGGGGEMAMLKGRVFEKAGVHVSTVFGEFAQEFRAEIPGAEK